METLARHLDVPKRKEKVCCGGGIKSWCLCLPRVLIGLSGFTVGLTMVLAALKLDGVYVHLQWWQVLLPIIVTLGVFFIVLTVAVVLWARFVIMVGSGDIDCDANDVGLDVVFRTAKICLLGHGYALMLVLSAGLLLYKLYFWPSLPVAYPLMPVIMLGVVYIILGVLLKQPEVDSPWFLVIGTSVLSQAIMLILKLDIMQKSKGLPWAAVFLPSWITYVILLSYAALCIQWNAQPASAPETTPETPTYEVVAVSPRVQVNKGSGLACWAIGWGLSQVLVSLRLDGLHKIAWFAIALPALLGWVLLLIFTFAPVSEYFEDMAVLLFSTFSLGSSGYESSSDLDEEQQPLLSTVTRKLERARKAAPKVLLTVRKTSSSSGTAEIVLLSLGGNEAGRFSYENAPTVAYLRTVAAQKRSILPLQVELELPDGTQLTDDDTLWPVGPSGLHVVSGTNEWKS